MKQWADRNHETLMAPLIKLPAQPVPDAKGNTNITIDAATLTNPGGGVWLMYMMSPTVWREKEFKTHFPNEKVYRHSLAEEAEALRGVLEVVKRNKVDVKKDQTLSALVAIEKDGMLESFILLDHADNGIAQDYVAYRKDHGDVMEKYVAKYDLHR